jgi:succinate dehydrogenase / fumarate reductase flavoprotein subunit
MAQAYPMTDHTYDVLVIGAGGAGLRATLGTACVVSVLILAFGG